jgi:hypothetical protein
MRYELDTGAERAVSWLRLGAAVVCGLAGAWVLATGGSTVTFVVGLAGVLAAAGWVFAWRAGQRRARRGAETWLDIAPDALTLADGKERHHVKWAEVTNVDVDEEKLVLRLGRAGRPDLVVEPRYRGAGLHEIEAAVRQAWTEARGRGNA